MNDHKYTAKRLNKKMEEENTFNKCHENVE